MNPLHHPALLLPGIIAFLLPCVALSQPTPSTAPASAPASRPVIDSRSWHDRMAAKAARFRANGNIARAERIERNIERMNRLGPTEWLRQRRIQKIEDRIRELILSGADSKRIGSLMLYLERERQGVRDGT